MYNINKYIYETNFISVNASVHPTEDFLVAEDWTQNGHLIGKFRVVVENLGLNVHLSGWFPLAEADSWGHAF